MGPAFVNVKGDYSLRTLEGRVAGGNLTPPGSHGTGREPLGSSGSCRSVGSGGEKMPMSEEPGIALFFRTSPVPRQVRLPSQSLELPHCPSDQMLVDARCDGIQLALRVELGSER